MDRGILCWAVLLGLALQSCSSVAPTRNHRMGLFDDLMRRDQAHRGHSRGPDAVTVEDEDQDDGSPGAVAVGSSPESKHKMSAEVAAEVQRAKLHWPLARVQVTSPYGKRGHEFHEGIDLRAKVGTPVYAAQAGTVLYADSRIGGYGKMIVIKHTSGLATVYGHKSRLLVKRGDRVREGQKIAMSGKTGRAHGPHLHFEVRHGVAALDPSRLMPLSRVAIEKVGSDKKIASSSSDK